MDFKYSPVHGYAFPVLSKQFLPGDLFARLCCQVYWFSKVQKLFEEMKTDIKKRTRKMEVDQIAYI